MLAEKNEEIQNAKERLIEMKEKSMEKIVYMKWDKLNDLFFEADASQVPGFIQNNPLSNINLQSQKIDSKVKLLSQMKEKKTFRFLNPITQYDSFDSSEEIETEQVKELKLTKGEFYEAVDEIMKDIEEEFKSIPLIIKQFQELQNT